MCVAFLQFLDADNLARHPLNQARSPPAPKTEHGFCWNPIAEASQRHKQVVYLTG